MAEALLDERAAQVQRVNSAKASMELNGGALVLTGMCHRAERTNINRRFYGKALLEREVADFTAQLLLRGSAYGELDHPDPDSPFFRQINCNNASHRVLDLWWEGNDLHATMQVLDTPAGRLVRNIYLAGQNIGIASRGWATLRPDEHDVVHVSDDYMLITFDCVPRPAFERQMEPMVTRCAALPAAQLLEARTRWWYAHLPAPAPPAWPWGPFHGTVGQREALDSICMVHGQPMAPAVELMRHDPAFRMRVRCFLLAHARLRRESPGAGLGSLPAQLTHHVIALAAHAEAQDCVGGLQPSFVAAPAPTRVRLCARAAQFPPLGADWTPLLQAVSAAETEAAALRDAEEAMDADEPCLGLLTRARRGAAAVQGFMRSAVLALRAAPPARAAAQREGDVYDLLAEDENFDGLDDDGASTADDDIEPAMLNLVLEDSGDERSDAGGWHAIHGDD